MTPTIGLLAFCAFLTAIISAVSGMAGGIVLLSIMTFFLPLSVIIPVHGLVQLISNSSRCWLLKDSIEWKIFRPFLIGLPLGGLVATFIIKNIHNREHFLILIGCMILYTLFKPKKLPHFQIPYWGFSLVGICVGILGPLIGATGPFIAVFFIRDDLDKKGIVATKASVQMLGHIIKIPIFIYTGFNYLNHSVLIALLAIGALLGTKVGVKILHSIPEEIFRLVYKSALFIAACRIFYKVII